MGMNKREFVAKCLMVICLLKEGDAYEVMMKAHREGVGVVGTYNYEKAEAYCEGLKAKDSNGDGFVTLVEFQENILPKTRKKIEMKLEEGWTFDKIKWDESCDRHKAA